MVKGAFRRFLIEAAAGRDRSLLQRLRAVGRRTGRPRQKPGFATSPQNATPERPAKRRSAMTNRKEYYPVLDIDLDIIRENARVMCDYLGSRGISVAGVIKFSDGDLRIAKAYHDGGCRQIASSRTVHLRRIREAMPQIRTMLIRIPMISEADEVVQWCDMSLNSEESVLQRLEEAAAEHGVTHEVILMQDVGDRREGVMGTERLAGLALKVERDMPHLHLAGIGSSFACVSGVLPDEENLGELARSAIRIEKMLGRKLEIVSGGSSISLTLPASGRTFPPEISHLRIGGAIANPMAIRRNRGVVIEGLREDAFTLTAEIVEVCEKPSPPQGERKNWSGRTIEIEDRGVRTRAIAALGSQDIGDAMQLVPLDPGITIVGGSSDHTVLDVTDSGRDWKPGDTPRFRLYYTALLYAFATRHVEVRYHGTE